MGEKEMEEEKRGLGFREVGKGERVWEETGVDRESSSIAETRKREMGREKLGKIYSYFTLLDLFFFFYHHFYWKSSNYEK